MARSERLYSYHQFKVPRHKNKALSLAVIVSFTLLAYYQLGSRGSTQSHSFEESCVPDIKLLSQYGLSQTIDYARLHIAVGFSDREPTSAEAVDQPLPDFESVDLRIASERSGSDLPGPLRCNAPLRLTFPKRVYGDASHIIFGVATTFERLEASIDSMAYWLGHSNARLIALIPPAPGAGSLVKKMVESGIAVTILQSDETFDSRYFTLIKLAYEQRRSSTRWVGIIDDDTFFLSMPALVSRLDTYDAKKSLYIGGLSEDLHQMCVWGYMAYGGAGIFLSIPLLKELNNAFDECFPTSATGDNRLAQCIYLHTTTKLTWEEDLHQIDLQGDPSGFYEAGRRQPLSIHHWKERYPINVTAMSTVSSVCGESCLLKQLRFSDGWFLNNGYSVVKYSEERFIDNTMEKTWDDHGESTAQSYVHTLGPLLPKDEGKISLKLEHALEEKGLVRQFYIRRPGNGGIDQVLEVVWTTQP